MAVRDRQRRLDVSDLRAETLEREQEAAVREILARERAEIAREMHDVLAHNVSVMVLQAGAARQALDDSRPITREPLVAVETTGREALAELRRLLGLLRPEGDSEALAPQPTLRDVDDLVERVSATGLGVTLRIQGTPSRLPQDLELSAFRIIHESLTNVIKHANATRAQVVLSYDDRLLDIKVSDDGTRSQGPGASNGHGLMGLRERASLFGGRLDASATDGGGFQVHASLPTDGRRL